MPSQISIKSPSGYGIIVVIWLVLAFATGNRCVPQYFIESHGIATVGTVVSIEHHGIHSYSGWYVSYTITNNGVTYYGSAIANPIWAKSLGLPSQIHVRFFPYCPSWSRPDVADDTPLFLNFLGTLVFLSLAVYYSIKMAKNKL